MCIIACLHTCNRGFIFWDEDAGMTRNAEAVTKANAAVNNFPIAIFFARRKKPKTDAFSTGKQIYRML
jgi:hypothetical protein